VNLRTASISDRFVKTSPKLDNKGAERQKRHFLSNAMDMNVFYGWCEKKTFVDQKKNPKQQKPLSNESVH